MFHRVDLFASHTDPLNPAQSALLIVLEQEDGFALGAFQSGHHQVQGGGYNRNGRASAQLTGMIPGFHGLQQYQDHNELVDETQNATNEDQFLQ